MADLYRVEVVAVSPSVLELKLELTPSSTSVPIGRSFAAMLLEEEVAPCHARLEAWRHAMVEENEDFDAGRTITRVAVVSSTGMPVGAVPADGDGVVVVAIHVDQPGLLDHFAVGDSWRSTAHDELDDGTVFTGLEEDARIWNRPPPVVVERDAPGAFRLGTRDGDWLSIEVFTLGELLAPTPKVWLGQLRFLFPGLASSRVEDASSFIAAVTLDALGGAREPKGVVKLDKKLALVVKGALEARYRIQIGPRFGVVDELYGEPVAGRTFLVSWGRKVAFEPAPAASRPDDASTFLELLELSAMDGPEAALAMMRDGIDGTRDVVLAALSRVESGQTPLAGAIARWMSCEDAEVAQAAIATARRLAWPELELNTRLAGTRQVAAATAAT